MNQDDSRSIISFSLRGWVRIIQVDHHWYLSGMNGICMIERRSFLVAKGFQFPSRTSFNFGIKNTPRKHAMTVDKLGIGDVKPKFLGSMWDLGEGIFASISQFVYSTKKSFIKLFKLAEWNWMMTCGLGKHTWLRVWLKELYFNLHRPQAYKSAEWTRSKS